MNSDSDLLREEQIAAAVVIPYRNKIYDQMLTVRFLEFLKNSAYSTRVRLDPRQFEVRRAKKMPKSTS